MEGFKFPAQSGVDTSAKTSVRGDCYIQLILSNSEFVLIVKSGCSCSVDSGRLKFEDGGEIKIYPLDSVDQCVA